MKDNPLRSIWKENGTAINAWLSIANPFSAEIMSKQGYDCVTVDTQHGIIDYQSMVSMLQGISASPVTPLVRVPWLDAGHVMKALDAGAKGIICPMINNREQAETLVSYMRYPPLGTRSFGPTRAVISEGSDYYQHANAEVVALAMVETAEAMENLEEIVTTPGLDGVYIGPADLSIGYTNGRLPPGMDRTEPEMVETIQKILSAAHDAGIKACLHTGSADYAAKAAGWGFDLVTLTNDVRLLVAAASDEVSSTRALMNRGSE